MPSQPLFQNTFILRKTRVANFADIIKNLTIFTKTTFEDSKNSKDLELCIKMQSIHAFPDILKFTNFQ